MVSRSALQWRPAGSGTTPAQEGRLSSRHGETIGQYTPGSIPGTPGQAARHMLTAHQVAYGCECTREWWTYYQPGGAGWEATDDALPDGALPDASPRESLVPRWRYHHVIGSADTDRTEKELERLSASGWEVVTLAISPGRIPEAEADFVYLLRKPGRDDA